MLRTCRARFSRNFDLFANEKLKAALKARDIVAGIASEEEDEIVVFEGCEHAKYVVLMDPLDGSSNIDVNVSVGTIFSIYRRVTPVGTPVTEEDFLQPGNKQVGQVRGIRLLYHAGLHHRMRCSRLYLQSFAGRFLPVPGTDALPGERQNLLHQQRETTLSFRRGEEVH